MDQHKDLPNWKKRKAEVERAVKMLAQKRERTLYLYEVEKQSRRRTKEQQLRTLLEYETKEMQRAQAGLQAINNRITVLEKDQQRYSSLRMIGLIFIFAFLFTFAGLIVHHYGNDQVVVEESRSESWITDIFTFLKRYSAGNNALTGAVVGIPDGNCHEEVHCVNEAPPAKEEILPAEVEEPIEEIPPDAAETTERKSPTIGIQEITIQNAPSITLVLNTTNLIRNDTDTNLTAYNTTQTNGNSLKVIYNWLRNGTSIAVLNMPFEGINGTTTNNAYDYSGNRNNGSDSVGVFWNATGGYDGKGAYLFNQTNTRIDIVNSGSLNFTGLSYSISFRVKREAVQNTGFGSIINKGGSGGQKIYILIQSDGTLWRWDGFNSGYLMPANEWHHVIYTFNAINDTNGTERFYVDGSLQTTRAGLVPSSNDQSILSIGSAAGSHPFNGTLDEMMIFNRSLSAEQIYAIWTNQTNVIAAQETNRGENWTVHATPNNGTGDGTVVISNNLTILNAKPVLSTLVLNTTNLAANDTMVNLTAYATTSDNDSDSVKVIYNWLRNGTSIAVLNMPFEGINGTTTNNAYDYSGNRNNGSDSVGVFWNATGGYDGKGAYLFNQTNTRIDIANSGSLNFTNASYSISFRVKRESVQNSGFGTIINKGGAGGLKIYILIQSDGTLWRWDGFNSGYGMPANEWHHIIYTFNAINDTNGTERFYVDGSLQATRAGLVPAANDQSILSIGSAAGSHPFNGTLDEMMIFNRSLSAEQIYAIWQNKTDTITANETTRGENWTVQATPNDGYEDGTVIISNNLTVRNTFPTTSTLVLNSTNISSNKTEVNLTAYATTSDADGDPIKVIYNWLRNGTSIAVLNMPFEGINGTTTNNAYDYSGNRNNGSDSVGVFWNATGGYDGKGAYLFNQTNTRIDIVNSGSLNFTGLSYSISFRVKREAVQNTGFGSIINKGGAGGQKIYILIQSVGTLSRWDTFNSGYLMPANEWHHVIYTFNAINDTNGTERFYVDGSLQATRAGLVPSSNDQSILSIGSAAGSHPFNGTLDEMMIFNRSLSAEQIFAIWQNKTDIIVANETVRGENWTVQATPNDGTYDGAMVISNNLTIRNTAPSAPILLNLTNDSTVTTRTPTLIWNVSDDDDGDISTYRIEIDDNILFNNLEVNVGGITNTSLTNVTYTLSTELSVDTSYFWRVFANDSSDGSGASAVRNFTVQSYLAINVTTDTVAFGTLSTGTNVSTPANAQPFRAENVGNIIANITVTGTSFFTFMHFPTTFYRFKIRANESGAFNVTASATEWNQTNTTLGANIFHVINLDWHSISNDFITDLNVSVPLNESPGSKSSTVTFTITG